MKAALCPNCHSLHTMEGVVFDEQRGVISWPGGSVKLSGQQFAILETLLRQHVASRDFLISTVWDDPDYEPDTARGVLGVHICKMRRILAAAQFPGEIRNIFGRGYELVLHKPDKAAA